MPDVFKYIIFAAVFTLFGHFAGDAIVTLFNSGVQ